MSKNLLPGSSFKLMDRNNIEYSAIVVCPNAQIEFGYFPKYTSDNYHIVNGNCYKSYRVSYNPDTLIVYIYNNIYDVRNVQKKVIQYYYKQYVKNMTVYDGKSIIQYSNFLEIYLEQLATHIHDLPGNLSDEYSYVFSNPSLSMPFISVKKNKLDNKILESKFIDEILVKYSLFKKIYNNIFEISDVLPYHRELTWLSKRVCINTDLLYKWVKNAHISSKIYGNDTYIDLCGLSCFIDNSKPSLKYIPYYIVVDILDSIIYQIQFSS
jgi:hypothetical protein